MRQIEDARKKYEEIPIPQELSGRVRAAIVRSEESGRVRSKKYQWPEYTEETGYTEETRYTEETGYGGYVPVRQQPLCWYLLRR